MVVSVLPVALIASATALPSGSVKPPSISTASREPVTRTGARKNPFSPAGKCFQVVVFIGLSSRGLALFQTTLGHRLRQR
jgi:hypothetical protein